MAKENTKSHRFGWLAFIVILLFILAVRYVDFSVLSSLKAYPNVLKWLVSNFYPKAETWEKLPDILEKLVETLAMSIAATTTSAPIAFIFALLASEVTAPNNIVKPIASVIASVFRNIPDIVWSMILLFSFGMNTITGYLALFFVSFGTLTRAFVGVINSSAGPSVEALQATGASWWQIVGQSVFPDSITGIISWILYNIEENVRSATLVGMLTGSGIGQIFDLYYKRLDYATCSLIVIVIVLVVLIIEYVSGKVRKAIL